MEGRSFGETSSVLVLYSGLMSFSLRYVTRKLGTHAEKEARNLLCPSWCGGYADVGRGNMRAAYRGPGAMQGAAGARISRIGCVVLLP